MCGSHKEPFPVVITRSQYAAIHRYRTILASREGKQASGNQSGEQQQQQQQADDEFRLVLANMFKDGLPDWFPLNELLVGGESNDSGPSEVRVGGDVNDAGPSEVRVGGDFNDAGPSEVRVGGESNYAGPSEVRVVSAPQPTVTTTTTTTTTTAAPAAAPHAFLDDFDQILNDESLVFDPESAEGWENGFPPILDEAGFDISVAYANALSSSTTPESSPDPVGSSQLEELPPCQPSGSGWEFVDKEGRYTSASGSSTSPAPAPLARVEEQHSLHPPSHLDFEIDLEGFHELDATHTFLSELLPRRLQSSSTDILYTPRPF